MRNSRAVKTMLFMAAALLLTAMLFRSVLLKTEPTFEGKSLSHWIDQLPSIDIGPDGRSETINFPIWYETEAQAVADAKRVRTNIKKAHEALVRVGTNHLEILVERLQATDSPVKTKVWELANRLRIMDYPSFRCAAFRRGQALSAFQYLRSRAKPVGPQLLDLTNTRNTNTQLLAWSALEVVAPEEFR